MHSYSTPEQARDLLKAARGDRFEALHAPAIPTDFGRVNDGLRWQDVDLESRNALGAPTTDPHQG